MSLFVNSFRLNSDQHENGELSSITIDEQEEEGDEEYEDVEEREEEDTPNQLVIAEDDCDTDLEIEGKFITV